MWPFFKKHSPDDLVRGLMTRILLENELDVLLEAIRSENATILLNRATEIIQEIGAALEKHPLCPVSLSVDTSIAKIYIKMMLIAIHYNNNIDIVKHLQTAYIMLHKPDNTDALIDILHFTEQIKNKV